MVFLVGVIKCTVEHLCNGHFKTTFLACNLEAFLVERKLVGLKFFVINVEVSLIREKSFPRGTLVWWFKL